ncbi:MAG: lipid-A-disaccharide synthase [Pirellulaceae bacterium]|nr:lipid-A-disaccharide synthase [Pirellulaceae bacterium]
MRVFISAGEPSGDLHGANLVHELQAEGVQCVGFGGPRMQEAGCQLYHDMTQYAVMFLQALKYLPQIWAQYRHADRIFATGQIDAVVLIDFPGFNWWVAKAAKRHRVPVFYYGVPQMWGWLPWRVHKLRRLVDHVLCKLPFEVPWFADRGVTAHYVGHPYFDELHQRQLDTEFLQEYGDPRSPLITLLPGSRNQEVDANLECLLETAVRIKQEMPQASFAVACFHPAQAEFVRQVVASSQLPIDVFVKRTPELIELSTLCLACSGSVSLELMYHEKPSIIVYRLKRLQAIGKWFLMTCRFVTLVNLLATDDISRRAGRPGEATGGDPHVPFPEFAWLRNPAKEMAALAIEWLRDPRELQRRRQQLIELKAKYARPGATARAAQYLVDQFQVPAAVDEIADVDLPASISGAAAAAARKAQQPVGSQVSSSRRAA